MALEDWFISSEVTEFLIISIKIVKNGKQLSMKGLISTLENTIINNYTWHQYKFIFSKWLNATIM